MNLSYRNQLIVASVLVVVLAALVVVLLVAPQVRTLSELDAQVGDAQSGVSQAQTLLTQRQEIKARAAQTEATRLRLANQIPENPELPTLIVELQDTINAAGLEFSSITPNTPSLVDDTPFSAVVISVDVRGSWQDTVDLLQRLRALTRQVRITNFIVARTTLGVDDDEDAPNEVVATIGLEVYTMPADVAPPATIPPPPDAAE